MPKTINNTGKFQDMGTKLGQLVEEKQVAYGDSITTCVDAFKILFPDGIPPERYDDALIMVRVWDKLMRIATAKKAFGESPWKDIVGYGILGAVKDE